jgi:hypothetical protein
LGVRIRYILFKSIENRVHNFGSLKIGQVFKGIKHIFQKTIFVANKNDNMKKARYILLSLFTIVSIATSLFSCKSGAGSDGKPVDLKMNFKDGDKYLYTTKISQNIGLMQGLSMDQNMTVEMIYTGKGEASGNKTLDITYDHIAMEMKSPMGGMQYDSKNPNSDNTAMGLNIMDSIIGKSFEITLGPDGHILTINGLDKIIQSFNLGDDAKAQMSIKNQLSDTAIRMMMQNSFDMYPGHAVKVGDTWNKKEQMTFSGINVNVDNTYTLVSVESGKANLSLSSILDLPKVNVGKDSESSQVEMTGKQTGNLQVDIATGQVVSSQIHSDIKGKMNIQGAPQDINIKGTIIITSKKI